MRRAYRKFCYEQHFNVQDLYEPLKFPLIRLAFKLYILLFITLVDTDTMECHLFLLLSYKPRPILPNPELHLGEEKKSSIWDDKGI